VIVVASLWWQSLGTVVWIFDHREAEETKAKDEATTRKRRFSPARKTEIAERQEG
jgi:hypothetical protein